MGLYQWMIDFASREAEGPLSGLDLGSTPVPFLTETSVWIGQVSPPLGARKGSWPDLSELA